ncbi:hypothetical protein R6Q57_004762 [Mikania cordata]
MIRVAMVDVMVDAMVDSTRRPEEMAQVSIAKKASVLAIATVAISATIVSGQEFASAPAPSPDAGAALSLPVSGVMIGSSLILSFIALFRN